MDVHRRIALAAIRGRAARAGVELADRFGPLPEPVANLVAIQEARIALAPLGAVALSVRARPRIASAGLTLGRRRAAGPPRGHPRAALHGAKRELSLRVPEGRTAMEAATNLVAGIFEVRGRVSFRPA